MKELFSLSLFTAVLTVLNTLNFSSSLTRNKKRLTFFGGGIKVEFDSAKIKCYNRRTNQYINSEEEVKEPEPLQFEAQLSEGKIIDEWFLNGVQVQTGGTGFDIRE